MTEEHSPKLYMVMDGRERYGSDRAVCLVVEETLEEAKKWLEEFGDAVVVETKFTGQVDEQGRPIYGEGVIVYDPQA
jgi:hypothetical protein